MRQLSLKETLIGSVKLMLMLGALILAALTLYTDPTQAAPGRGRGGFPSPNGALKRDPIAKTGQCTLQAVRSEADVHNVFKAYKMQTANARPEERLALANGLYQTTALFGGVFTPLVNSKVSFFQRGGPSRQLGRDRKGCGQLHMARCSGGKCQSTNIAHLMHELGHQVGNSSFPGGGNYYSQFRKVGSGCYPTKYSTAKANENFAEIFASYLTNPELLSNGNAACKRAYAFFSDKVFRSNGRMASCQSKQKQELMAAVSATQPGGIQLASLTAPSSRPSRATAATPANATANIRTASVVQPRRSRPTRTPSHEIDANLVTR